MTTPQMSDAGYEVTILRSPKSRENPYVQISRKTAQDSRLSFDSRGLLLYILSKPVAWHAQRADLQREGNIGRDKLNSLLKELREAGYIERLKERNPDGTFKWTLLVYESPDMNPGTHPPTENPVMDESMNGSTIDGSTIDGKSALASNKVRARAGGPNSDHKDLSNKDVYKRKKPRLNKHPAIELFKKVTKHYPRQVLYEQVITALRGLLISEKPDIERLKLYYTTWVARGYNEYGMDWLFVWYRDGVIPERSGTRTPAPATDDHSGTLRLRKD